MFIQEQLKYLLNMLSLEVWPDQITYHLNDALTLSSGLFKPLSISSAAFKASLNSTSFAKFQHKFFFAMNVICLEDQAFHTLIEEVVNRLEDKNTKEDQWISGEACR